MNKNNNKVETIRKVSLIGFSGSSLALLEYYFASIVDCELVTPSQAGIIIVNGDQAAKEEDVQADIRERFPTASYIVISARDISWDGFVLLKKPHTPDELINLIRSFDVADGVDASDISDQDIPDNEPALDPKSLDYYRGGTYSSSRKRKGEALKQKLIRGNLVVNAADRLVQQVQADLEEQEEKLQEQLKAEQAQHEAALQKKKEKIRQLKLQKIAEKKKHLEEKHRQLGQKKKQAIQQDKAKKQLSCELTAEQVLQCCGNAADVDFSRPYERRSVFHTLKGSLLVVLSDAIEFAKKQKKPVELTGLPGQLFILPETNEIYSTFNDDFLNQLALTRFGYGELAFAEHADFELGNKEKNLVEKIEPFVWKVAVWTSRGRLLTGISPEKPMQLKQRPDFDLFLPLPHGDDISEVWGGNSLTALDVAKILDVPQRIVFSYMSGAFSLGWFQA
ncbi:MAG: hypothetical protein CSA60_04010 [Neptuniibacter caesariensis]|uniref:Uncharacterized protein n=1 Tax=Neptuniibacter caesariensis TaxID=207954 RepID=A0A2G6JKH9_NEPCE|nr:MAG: hypothetical protein CSA60_04010 [Neptuniibacter caesariensis]